MARKGESDHMGQLMRKGGVPAALCALLFALAQVVGSVFSKADAADGYALHWPPLPLTFLALVAIAMVAFVLLCLLFGWLDARRAKGWRTFSAQGRFARHSFAISAVIIAVCWLPYLVVFFPGSLPWDGVRSMNQFITDAPLENHHPVLMNALYAGLMTLGRTLYSDNLGLLLIVVFQYVACVVSFALCIRQLVRMDSPRGLVIVSLAFVALHPVWGAFAQAAFKDTLFNGVLCLFVLAVVCVLRARPATRRDWVLLLLASLALCFTRNNGIYLAAPTLLVVLIYVVCANRRIEREAWACMRTGLVGSGACETAQGAGATQGAAKRVTPDAGEGEGKRERVAVREARTAAQGADASGTGALRTHMARRESTASAGVTLGVTVLAYLLAFQVIYPLAGIAKEEKEMLSVPFQQTARCLLEHPDDVTDEERAAISAILPYDELASLYNPDLSDPVKESVYDEHGNMTPEQRSDYFSAWLSMGLRHPLTYLRATIANTYAYFYPWEIIGEDIDRPVLHFYMQGEPINQTFDVHYLMPDELRQAVNDFLVAQYDVPVLQAIWSPALYIWIFLVLCAYALRSRNYAALIVAIPLLMLLITTLAGPLNGHLRYILPLAAALPLFAGCVVGVSGSRPQVHRTLSSRRNRDVVAREAFPA